MEDHSPLYALLLLFPLLMLAGIGGIFSCWLIDNLDRPLEVGASLLLLLLVVVASGATAVPGW